jgi:hypothetical protein
MKPSLERAIEELDGIYGSIKRAIELFPHREFCESENKLRYEAVRNVLLVTASDVSQCLQEWRIEIKERLYQP